MKRRRPCRDHEEREDERLVSTNQWERAGLFVFTGCSSAVVLNPHRVLIILIIMGSLWDIIIHNHLSDPAVPLNHRAQRSAEDHCSRMMLKSFPSPLQRNWWGSPCTERDR